MALQLVVSSNDLCCRFTLPGRPARPLAVAGKLYEPLSRRCVRKHVPIAPGVIDGHRMVMRSGATLSVATLPWRYNSPSGARKAEPCQLYP